MRARNVKRLLCFVLGHGHESMEQDLMGAAWMVCERCGKVTYAHTWHGGRPWDTSDES